MSNVTYCVRDVLQKKKKKKTKKSLSPVYNISRKLVRIKIHTELLIGCASNKKERNKKKKKKDKRIAFCTWGNKKKVRWVKYAYYDKRKESKGKRLNLSY